MNLFVVGIWLDVVLIVCVDLLDALRFCDIV